MCYRVTELCIAVYTSNGCLTTHLFQLLYVIKLPSSTLVNSTLYMHLINKYLTQVFSVHLSTYNHAYILMVRFFVKNEGLVKYSFLPLKFGGV